VERLPENAAGSCRHVAVDVVLPEEHAVIKMKLLKRGESGGSEGRFVD